MHVASYVMYELHKYDMKSILSGWQISQATNKGRKAEMVLVNILHGFLHL